MDEASRIAADDALHIARHLPIAQAEWLAIYDRDDEEWCPPRVALAMVRTGLIRADDMDGGYLLTPLGLAVRQHLMEAR